MSPILKHINYANRGNFLEQVINSANYYYEFNNLALIRKRPTPIKILKTTPVKRKHKKGYTMKITEAVFEDKSSLDYEGIFEGYSVCFDAKSTKKKNIPLANIANHQIEYMIKFNKQKGITFLIVYFEFCNEFYLLPFELLIHYYEKSKTGGRKSIPYTELSKNFKELLIANSIGCMLDYLPTLKKYIELKNNNYFDYLKL